jgi:phytoene dehydrogenase-like protein
MSTRGRVVVVGAGPNGLAAAIVAAQAGYAVEVYEAEDVPGGAARTLELTLPGFLHDFGSAVHPMAAGSPFFKSIPLADYGVQWIHSPSPLAHPLDDGTAVMLERDLADAERGLGPDGATWRRTFGPFSARWDEFASEVFEPMFRIPRHPLQLAKFGARALLPATTFCNLHFRSERTKALFAGIAAHSTLALDEPMSAAIPMVLAIAAHAVGWPIPRGGAGSITQAMVSYLRSLGGAVNTGTRVQDLRSLGEFNIALCDITPRQLLGMQSFPPAYTRLLHRYRYGPGVFKVDYALSSPVPWRAKEVARAATVHIGGSLAEVAASERTVRNGQPAERPFVLASQPTLFDPSRAPDGKHVLWAYCHVPNGSHFDMLERLESQIERFAPGFRDCIMERRVWLPSDMEARDASLVGGDINAGLPNWRQFFLRPTWRMYGTAAPKVYLCSAATPPGGGVHGMCGANAARLAIKRAR